MTHIKIILFLIALSSIAFAHDYIPSPSQSHAVLLKGGDLYTVSSGILKETDLMFEKGRITQIGKNITPPDGCIVHDITGKNVYPGLIAPNTSLGLVEIGQVAASDDKSELGKNNADVQTHIAYNPDSEVIPSVRSNGVTTALVVPSGSLISGRSSLINLDGWTKEDAMEKENVALHLSWPSMRVTSTWWMEKSVEEQKKENEENARQIYEIFDEAKAYYLAKKAGLKIDQDLRLDAMYPIFTGELPVFIHASEYTQIDAAIEFSKKYGIRMVLVGGTDSWRISERLKANNIPVILSKTQSLPSRQDEDYDLRYKLPALLQKDSVQFCLSYGSYTGTRNLPFQASQAVAFGLPENIALRSVTLSTAEILGVDGDLGSLEIGKKATLIVSKGDVLDHMHHNVIYEFIEGRQVNLDNKHKELYRKYKEKTIP